MNRGEILPTPDIGVYALHYAKLAAIARRTIARQADGKAWRGMDIQRPPYKDEVQYADDLLIQYGGHPMAAGFSIQADRIEDFRQRLIEYAAAHMKEEDYIPQLAVDGELRPDDITLSLVGELSQLEPYGMGNSRPVFSLQGCTARRKRQVQTSRCSCCVSSTASRGSGMSS